MDIPANEIRVWTPFMSSWKEKISPKHLFVAQNRAGYLTEYITKAKARFMNSMLTGLPDPVSETKILILIFVLQKCANAVMLIYFKYNRVLNLF